MIRNFFAICGILGLFIGTLTLIHGFKGNEALNWNFVISGIVIMFIASIVMASTKDEIILFFPMNLQQHKRAQTDEKIRRKREERVRRRQSRLQIREDAIIKKKALQSEKKKYSISKTKKRHLEIVEYACTVEGFEWVFAHIDNDKEAGQVRETLLSLGFAEMAAVWDKLHQLFAHMEPAFEYDGELKAMSFDQDEALMAFNILELNAKNDGSCERFVERAKPYLSE